MQSVFEAVGGEEGLLRLAHAWHARVMADQVVSHAFSHGFHPQHSERLAALIFNGTSFLPAGSYSFSSSSSLNLT
jgi:hemoglobin